MSESGEKIGSSPAGGQRRDPAALTGGSEWSGEWSPPGRGVGIKEGSSDAKPAQETELSKGPDAALRSSESPDLSVDNSERARELSTEGQSIFKNVFESARYAKDRFSIWWDSRFAGVYENRMSELARHGDKHEQKAAGSQAREAAIQKQFEDTLAAIQKAGIEPDAELAEKVELEKKFHRREREEAAAKAGEFRERAEEMKAKMTGYKEKRDKTVEAMTGKWQEAIDGNNRQKSEEAAKLGEVDLALGENLEEQRRLMAVIADIKKLSKGPSKAVNAEIRGALRVKEEELEAKKEERRHYMDVKKEVDGSIAEIDKRNKRLELRVGKIQGKEGRVGASAAPAKTQAGKGSAAAGTSARAGESPEAGVEKLRPFSEFVKIWNEKSDMKVGSFGVTALEDVMDKESALDRIRGRLLFRYHTKGSRAIEDEVKRVRDLF